MLPVRESNYDMFSPISLLRRIDLRSWIILVSCFGMYYFVTRIGPDVNLGNVPASAIIGLETLRLGLRADTLTAFE